MTFYMSNFLVKLLKFLGLYRVDWRCAPCSLYLVLSLCQVSYIPPVRTPKCSLEYNTSVAPCYFCVSNYRLCRIFKLHTTVCKQNYSYLNFPSALLPISGHRYNIHYHCRKQINSGCFADICTVQPQPQSGRWAYIMPNWSGCISWLFSVVPTDLKHPPRFQFLIDHCM